MNTRRPLAVTGVSDHCGWAVLVTLGTRGAFLDRRRVELLDAGLPQQPYEHEAQKLPREEALRLIARVTESAIHCARVALDELERDHRAPIAGIALRRHGPLPATVGQRLDDYRARTTADSVLYRAALATAATGKGWAVDWYDAKNIIGAAHDTPGGDDLDQVFLDIRKTHGAPWNRDHQVAMAAALVARARWLED